MVCGNGVGRSITCGLMALISVLIGQEARARPLMGVVIGSNTLISINPTDGAWSSIGLIGGGSDVMNGLAYDGVHNVLYGIDPGADELFQINPSTGAGTAIGPFNNVINGNASGLEYDPLNNILWGCDPSSNRIFSVNTSNGHLSNGVVVQGFTGLEGLAMDVVSNVMYALADGQDRIIMVNPVTGSATALPVSLGTGTWRGLTFDPEQQALYATAVGDGSRLFRIDPLTGAATFVSFVGPPNSSVQGLAYIPAPGSLALMLVIGLVKRRRRRGA
jgi:hypothetical protein